MFCLGCGAEVPSRAARCRVCGRKLSSPTESSEATRDTFSASPSSSSLPQPATHASASLQTSVHSPPGASNVPDSSATGLPRDLAGRLLLLIVAALAADLFAPWSIVYGQQKTMAANGASAWALLALFALAALPLLRPNYRVRPHVAVAPLAVGAFCLGAGIFYWEILIRENVAIQPVADPSSASISTPPIHSSPLVSSVMPQSLIGPGYGLYLFLIGSAVLAFVGYRLFLYAAVASARATGAQLAQPASAPLSAVPAASASSFASASMSHAASIPPATALATPAPASSPLVAVSASEAAPASSAAPAAGHIVLPGSAAWNEAPKIPTHIRPSRLGSSGWSRQAGVRR